MEETDEKIIALIQNEEYVSASYKVNGMAWVAPYSYGNRGGYRILNTENSKYLEASQNLNERLGYTKKACMMEKLHIPILEIQ